MKVLKEGSVAEIWTAEVTCAKSDKLDKEESCGAVLEVFEEDLVVRYWKGTHFTHHYAAIKCPRCGKYTAVKNVPISVRERVLVAKKKNATFDGFSESIYG